MSRKVETIVTLTDDLDGSKADRTVTFAVDGTSYEIDLSKKNASAFEKALAPYVRAGRKVRGTTSRGRRGSGSAGRSNNRGQVAAIRAWARETGRQVPDRGRLPASIVEEYEAAH